MGQYYKLALGNHIFGHAGSKLMEHSWLGCQGALYDMIKDTPQRVANIGDYTEEDGTDCVEYPNDEALQFVHEGFKKAWQLARQSETYEETEAPHEGYLVNREKKEYISLKDFISIAKVFADSDKWGDDLIPSPLTILCASSNNKGGGDYYDKEIFAEYAGRWCGCLIEYTETEPTEEFQLEIIFLERIFMKPNFNEYSKKQIEEITRILTEKD